MGIWQLAMVYFRPDRLPRPKSALPVRGSKPEDAWCEDPRDGRYNRKISLPAGEGNETFWRGDEAYDIVIPTSHNTRPRVKGAGSAIFFHLTRKGSKVTAGCVAVSPQDMRKILVRCSAVTCLVIWPPEGGPPAGLRRSQSQRAPVSPPRR